MGWVRIILVTLAVIEGLWMTFDGTRALTVGDYVTRSTGSHAGELGPWRRVVTAVGIPPRSTAMKLIFVIYGLSWLVIALAFLLRAQWAWLAMFVAAVATLWYLPVGTLFGLIQLVLLLGLLVGPD
jgi:hypothetical protein